MERDGFYLCYLSLPRWTPAVWDLVKGKLLNIFH